MTASAPPPAALGKAGVALWQRLTADLDFAAWEVVVLEHACRLADAAELLEDHLAANGITTKGSTGQTRLDPALAELRQTRLSVARLLGQLDIPSDPATGKPVTRSAKSRRASRAAEARWVNVASLPKGKHGGA